MFTRQPGPSAPPAAAKVERGEGTGARELEIETTSYTPSDAFTPGDFETPPLSLDEELPRIDLAQEMDLGLSDDSMPLPAEPGPEREPEPAPMPGAEAAPEPELEPESEMGMELDLGSELEVGLEEGEAAQPEPPAPEMAIPPEPAVAPLDTLEEHYGEEFEELAPEEEPADTATGRGVFDTETLATIYINQGFYGRAAEIYQRLIDQRPDDGELRRKLESVLARERAEAGIEEPATEAAAAAVLVSSAAPAPAAPAQGEPAAAQRTGSEKLIGQLQTLLDTFREGRPR
jgi:hypothetical protein